MDVDNIRKRIDLSAFFRFSRLIPVMAVRIMPACPTNTQGETWDF